jgi:IS5 family transposase
MLRDRHEIGNLFMDIIKLSHQMDPVLARIDQVLEDNGIFQLIKSDLSKRYAHTLETGCPSTPVEVIMRMLAVKQLYKLSYEQTEYQVRDSLVLRQFCRVYLNAVPDDTTLIRWANLIRPETLHAFNERVTQLAVDLQVTHGRKLRTDGTVVETNMHAPSDSSLLADGVRVLGRTLQRARAVLAGSSDLATSLFRNRTRSARRTAREIGQVLRRASIHSQARGQKAYRRLVKITQATISQAKQVLGALKQEASSTADKLATTLDVFIPRVEQVIQQTVRRVFQDERVPAAEKIVSIFEPHTAIIRRGKASHPVEYGHKVWLDEVDGGIVSDYRVLEGNPNDSTQWQTSLDRHAQHFGHAPRQASADRGVYSEPNEQYAQQSGVRRVILPQPGHKSPERQAHERQSWFRRGRRWHAGIEGRISVLKRAHGLDRCRYHGSEGCERWVGWSVIAGNLAVIGRKVAARA